MTDNAFRENDLGVYGDDAVDYIVALFAVRDYGDFIKWKEMYE